ncbi:MAG: monovalent cation/H+ antiporter complex subunit F [Spirochaetia bacterium]
MPAFPLFLGALIVLICATVLRILIGPTIWDRLIGVGLIATKVTVAGVFAAVFFEAGYMLDMALIFAVLGFLASVIIARFIERRGTL